MFSFGYEPNGVTEWFLPLGGLRCIVFHSAKSHMSVLYWPASAPIKWTYETLLMCTHLEWCQLTEKTWRRKHLVGLHDSTQVSRHSHQKTRRTFNKLSSYLTSSTAANTLQWLMLDDERMHGMCTYVFPSFVFFSFTLQRAETKQMRGSGAVSCQTISLLRGGPECYPTAVFAQWLVTRQLPVNDSQTGCQHKLWSQGGQQEEGPQQLMTRHEGVVFSAIDDECSALHMCS